jgi:hypothetical protein
MNPHLHFEPFKGTPSILGRERAAQGHYISSAQPVLATAMPKGKNIKRQEYISYNIHLKLV